ncbi:MAG: hypothetical protein QOI86_5489 [Actinomycetota bacterium]|nr:hypothetical protein [Actinomycetota bacterium]
MPPREARGVVPRPATHRDHPPRPLANDPTPPTSPAATHPRHPGEHGRARLRPVLLGDDHSGASQERHALPRPHLARFAAWSIAASVHTVDRGAGSDGAGPRSMPAPIVAHTRRRRRARQRHSLCRCPLRRSPVFTLRRFLPPAALVFDLAFEFVLSLLLFVPWVLLFCFWVCPGSTPRHPRRWEGEVWNRRQAEGQTHQHRRC